MELLFERSSRKNVASGLTSISTSQGDQREKAIQYVYERYGKLGPP